MLTGTIHAVKRLFMHQANEAVLLRDALHNLHGQLVMVACNVGCGKYGRHFVLGRCNLIVLGLGEDAQLPQFLVQLLHERCHARADRTEIVVLHLLPLGRLGAEQRAAGEDQVLTLGVILLFNEEIFLLGADRGGYTANVLSEQLEHTAGLRADRFHRAQQRGLFVEDFAGVRAERRRDIERTVLNERIAGGVPCGIAARLKGCAQAAGRERGRIGFATDKLLTGELHHYAAVVRGGDEGVVLLGRDAGHRLEPVGVVRRALGNRPVLHGGRHDRGDVSVDRRTLPHRLFQLFVNVLGQTFLHDGLIKDHAAEQLGDILYCHHEWFAPLYVNLLPNKRNKTKQALRVVFPQRLCC